MDDAADFTSEPYVSEVDPDAPVSEYEELVTRHVQAVPKEFVHLVIEGKNTARDLLRLVNEHCGDDEEKLENFKFFIEHLRVANTRQGRNAIARVTDPDVLVTAAGRTWVRRHVMADLPGAFDMFSDTPKDTSPTNEILEALSKSTEATQRSVEAISKVVVDAIKGQATDKPSAKTIEATWPTTYGKLLNMMGVTATSKLPPLWPALAKASKTERMGALEGLLYQEAKKLHRGSYKFVVSSHQLKQIFNLQFDSRGDLEKGLNLFNTVCLTRYSQQAKDVTQFNEEDEWMEDAVTSLEDKKTHRKFKHAVLPKTASHFRELVTGYYIYLRVIFGADHPLTQSYKGLFEMVDEVTDTLEEWKKEEKAYERVLWGFHSHIDKYLETIGLPESRSW